MIDVWRIMSRWICFFFFCIFYRDYGYSSPGWVGRGGILWVQVTGIEWGQKWKPKKSLGLPTKSKQIAISKINPQKSYAEFLASHSGIFREQLVFQSCCLVGSQPNTSSPKIACVKDFWISEPLKFQKSMDITRKIKTLEIECFCLLIYHTIWSYLSASGSHFNSTRDSQEHFGVFITNLQIVWNTPQKSPVKSSRPKKYLPHFPSKKKPETKISNPPQSFDHPRLAWNPEYPSEICGFHFFLVQDTTVWVLLCKAFSNREKRSGDEIAFSKRFHFLWRAYCLTDNEAVLLLLITQDHC